MGVLGQYKILLQPSSSPVDARNVLQTLRWHSHSTKEEPLRTQQRANV